MAGDRALELEAIFMALADRTRLRLLNLMGEGEGCVNHFTEVLGESQPKVSRHLAYLRGSGLVDTRREGKWIYYSIRRHVNTALDSILESTLSALADDAELIADKRRLMLLSDAQRSGSRLEMPDPVSVVEDRRPSEIPSRHVHNELDEFLL